MNFVLACIDGSSISTSVCDASAWASQRLAAPLKLLHVLDKSEYPTRGNLSGNIGLGSREHLLRELTDLDEQRGRLALEHGKHMLEKAEERALQDGAVEVTKQQRHGSLVETLLEFEPEVRLFVMGRLGEGHDIGAHTVGSHLESVVRSVHRPILIALQSFTAPRRFMVAYDGSDTAEKVLAMVTQSPLLKGLPCHVVMVGTPGDERTQQLQAASGKLVAAGFEVVHQLVEGEVQPTLSCYQKENQIDLLVMGAYGHSRIRRFFVGSNTTRMISMSDIPILLLR